MIDQLKQLYASIFGSAPEVLASSPGRINLIGEHTDYNEGYVMPAAIDKKIYAVLGKRSDNRIGLYSADFKLYEEADLNQLIPIKDSWTNYVKGVVDQLLINGHVQGGFNIVIGGDVPLGAGLSSSAAMECTTIIGLNQLFQLELNKLTMVKLAQLAEHTFAGVQCGIMDQFASVFGKNNHVMQLDCRSLDYVYKPLELNVRRIVLLDTRVKHSLASTAYNERRLQCLQGVAIIQAKLPDVKSLRDVSLSMLDEYALPLDQLVYQRCRYVVEENARVLAAAEDLQNGNLKNFGKKMFETHDGLSGQYEVSCNELDFLVQFSANHKAVEGARMMGGGFGGCTINLVKADEKDAWENEITMAYEQYCGLSLLSYEVLPEDGGSAAFI
ncbi:galactokinase [Flavihumibacter sp. UBA7668]|uniref:galactokinase n=1 Tax=Flavihumibacter sp. UBA7668 TaxID=1946542 RepID=UPI0025BCFB67|nr:galactokinase [Flavihumibacter sp. UBA7668]